MTADILAHLTRTDGARLGVYLGRVTRLDPDSGGLFLIVDRLDPDIEYGPASAVAGTYAPGDTVLTAPLETSAEELVVLGRVGPATPPPP